MTHFAHTEATLTLCGRRIETVEITSADEFTCRVCERAWS